MEVGIGNILGVVTDQHLSGIPAAAGILRHPSLDSANTGQTNVVFRIVPTEKVTHNNSTANA